MKFKMNIQVLLIICLINSSMEHHIIFENLGKMATGVTYLHVQLTLPMQEIEQLVEKFNTYVNKVYDDLTKEANKLKNEKSRHTLGYEISYKDIRVDECVEVAYTYVVQGRNLKHELSLLNKLMSKGDEHREKRQILLGGALLGGLVGTLFGAYNTYEIAKLKTEVGQIEGNQAKIAKAIIKTDKEIEVIHDSITYLDQMIRVRQVYNPSSLAVRLGQMEQMLHRLVRKTSRTIQMAQMQRMAIDFLEEEELDVLYQDIENYATKHDLTLLTQSPSDLYQLETSFISKGDITMFIHVPTVPKKFLIKLYRMHPLPLPINPTTALIPRVKHDILGLSEDDGTETQLSNLMSSIDLLQCKTLNKIYFCERHGVFNRFVKDSCLGALYKQDFKAAAKICKLQTTQHKEIIHQLNNN